MGTGKSGRYINTKGFGRSASDFAVVHSNEGKYTHPAKGQRIRLASGGHGQTGMNQLDKYGIKYNIVKTYPNGVRESDRHGFPKVGHLATLNMPANMLPD